MLSSCSDWRYSDYVDWISFVPSVITGGLLGVFIARARYWKRKYEDKHVEWAKEATLSSMTREHLQLAEDALKQAHMQHAAQMHSAKMIQAGAPGSPFTHIAAEDITDDMLEKILRDVNAQPKQFVIQEEL